MRTLNMMNRLRWAFTWTRPDTMLEQTLFPGNDKDQSQIFHVFRC